MVFSTKFTFTTVICISLCLLFSSLPGYGQMRDLTPQLDQLTRDSSHLNWMLFQKDAEISTRVLATGNEALGLGPNDELILQRQEKDELGITNSRYLQHYLSLIHI